MVEALPPDRADEALHVRILPRCPRRSEHLRDSDSGHAVAERALIHRIAVSEQVLRGGFPRKCLHDLLSRPLCGGLVCDVAVEDATPFVGENEKTKHDVKSDRRYGEEVDRDELRQVIFEEGAPSL